MFIRIAIFLQFGLTLFFNSIIAKELELNANYDVTALTGTRHFTPFTTYGYFNNHINNASPNLTIKMDFSINPANSSYYWNKSNNLVLAFTPSIQYDLQDIVPVSNFTSSISLGIMPSITAEKEVKEANNISLSHSQGRILGVLTNTFVAPATTYINDYPAVGLTLNFASIDDTQKFGISYIPHTDNNLTIRNNNETTLDNKKQIILLNYNFYDEYNTIGYYINLSSKQTLYNYNFKHNAAYSINTNISYFGFNIETGYMLYSQTPVDYYTTSFNIGYSIAGSSIGIYHAYMQAKHDISSVNHELNYTEYYLQQQLNYRYYIKIVYAQERNTSFRLKNDALFLGIVSKINKAIT